MRRLEVQRSLDWSVVYYVEHGGCDCLQINWAIAEVSLKLSSCSRDAQDIAVLRIFVSFDKFLNLLWLQGGWGRLLFRPDMVGQI